MSTLVHEIPTAIRDLLSGESDLSAVNGWLIDAYPFVPVSYYPLVEIITVSEDELNERQQTGSRTRTLTGIIRVTSIIQSEISWSGKIGTIVAAATHKEIIFNIVKILGTNTNRYLNSPTLTSGVVDHFKTGRTEFAEENVNDTMIYQGAVEWECDITENRT